MKELEKNDRFRLHRMALKVKDGKILQLEKERDEWKDRSDCFEDNLAQTVEELQTLKDEVRKYIYEKEDNYPKLKELIK